MTLVGLTGIAWALRPSVVLARSHVVVGAWGALASAFVHNMVDLNSEFPGILVALSVCAGMTVAGSSGAPPRSALASWSRRPRLVAGVTVIATVASAALVLADRNKDLYTDRAELHRLALAGTVDEGRFREYAHAAILRHPAEPYLPFTGAVRAFRNGDPTITLWASRVLDRAPVYGPVHLLLARTFVRSSPAQARLEYRLAMSQAPELLLSYLPETLRLVGTYEHAMELVPHDATGLEVLRLLTVELKARLPATQTRLGEELLLGAPNATEPLLERVEGVVADLLEPDGAPWCQADRAVCVQDALEQAKQYQALQPERCDGYRLYAEARIASGGDETVLDEFKRSAESVIDRSNCLKAYVSLVCKVGSDARIRAAIDQMVRAGCASVDECVANIHFAARIERERGNPTRALSFYRRAYERYPERDDSLVEAAEMAKKVGLNVEAMRLYSILARRNPDDARWAEALRDARTRAIQRRPQHP